MNSNAKRPIKAEKAISDQDGTLQKRRVYDTGIVPQSVVDLLNGVVPAVGENAYSEKGRFLESPEIACAN